MEGLKKLFLPITATLGFIQKYFKSMLFLLLVFVLFAPADEQDLVPNNLQEIKLVGPIFDTQKWLSRSTKHVKTTKSKGYC